MSNSQGFIKLHREVMDNPMYLAETFTRMAAWIDLLLLANHKQGFIYVRGNRITVKRGQVGMSESKLASRWKWSRGKVRRFLNELETEQQIVQQKSRVKSLITIVNYNKYQNNGTTDSTTNGQQTGQQTDTNKNVKNVKNIYRDIQERFKEFWNQYHSITGKPKTDKESAFKHWKRLSNEEQKKALTAIKPYFKSLNDPKFCKKARTYLSDKNFNDEFSQTGQPTNKPIYKNLRQTDYAAIK